MAGRVELVVFNGIKFRRYPDAPGSSERRYFVPGIADRQRGVRRLHEEVWIAHKGPIPPGRHVHHRNHNPSDNDPGNLELLTDEEHRAHHVADRHASGFFRRDSQLEHLERVRPLTAKWHRSDEGRAWHREHAAAQGFGQADERTERCQQCGAPYTTTHPSRGDRFCSNACKSAWRRASGVDDVDRECERCGVAFRVNRYRKTRFCGRSCARRDSAARARAGVEPDGR